MSGQRWRIHWAWVPAGIVFGAAVWIRQGWWVALLAAAAGLGGAFYAEWKARKRRRQQRDAVQGSEP